MSEQIEKLTQLIKVRSFILHAYTVKNTLKEMESVWDSLKVDGTPIMVTEHMTRTKAQCVQIYARKLMLYVRSITNFEMFPITLEDIQVGNWRIDSIILNIASNEIKSHEHLYQLIMTNIFGVPTVMFDFIKNDFSAVYLKEYMKTVFVPLMVNIPENETVTLEQSENQVKEFITQMLSIGEEGAVSTIE
ncbi:hypothetical protein [Aeromonas phage AerS_266]|nr:hypothetical protein [Aeromonas phage AerS_266]